MIDGTSVSYCKIKYNRDLQKCKTTSSPVLTDFQKLYGHLKSSGSKLLLVPLTTTALEYGTSEKSVFPYIDRPVEILTTLKKEFKNYLSYTIKREQVNGVFCNPNNKSILGHKRGWGSPALHNY